MALDRARRPSIAGVVGFQGRYGAKTMRFADYRFSEDLDFTLTRQISLEEIVARLNEKAACGLADQAEAYGYINRALPDADLDAFVEALATRIAKFDKWAIAQTKRLVNTSLPPDVELGAGWDACIASLGRSAAQEGIKALMARGFHKPGDVENRLGYYLGQIAR